jgi:large subunit ribosomal protein L29
MKLSEMRELEISKLDAEVVDHKKELMELRFQSAIGQLANPARVKLLRREVARLLTVKRQKSSNKES